MDEGLYKIERNVTWRKVYGCVCVKTLFLEECSYVMNCHSNSVRYCRLTSKRYGGHYCKTRVS